MRRPLFIVLVALIAAQRTSRATDCLDNFSWVGYAQIQVYIHPALDDYLLHLDGTPWAHDEVRREVEYVVETLQENLPSGAPEFVVQGDSSVNWNQFIPGAIHIAPDLGQTVTCDDMAVASASDTTPPTGLLVLIHRSGGDPPLENCPQRWEHYYVASFAEIYPLRGILNHELMHTLGQLHYNDPPPTCVTNWDSLCTLQPCSCTHSGESAVYFDNCYHFDWWNMDGVYGDFPNANRQHRQSTNGTSWTTLAAPPNTGPRPGLSSNASAPLFFVQKTASSHSLNLWKFTPASGWSDQGYLSSGTTLGSVGAAYYYSGLVFQTFVAWMGGESNTDVVDDLTVRRWTSSGQVTFTYPEVTTNQGVTAAYDPRSDRIILAYRDRHGHVKLQSVSRSGVFGVPYELSPVRLAGDAPSVTCGDASLARNCVVAWAHAPISKADGAYRFLRWKHFSYDGTNFNEGSMIQTSYVMFGPPSVSYRGPTSSSCAFMFATKGSPGPWYQTYCKTTAENTLDLTNPVGHGGTGRVMSPVIGSTDAALAEVINSWKL